MGTGNSPEGEVDS